MQSFKSVSTIAGGLETENKYPYDGEDEKCKFQLGDIAVYINGSVNISSSEAGMWSLYIVKSVVLEMCHKLSS